MTEQTASQLVPEPFILYDSPLYRVTMYSHGPSPRLALLQKQKASIVEFCDGDACRLVEQLDQFDSGNPWEDMTYVDPFLTMFDFQSTGMIQ